MCKHYFNINKLIKIPTKPYIICTKQIYVRIIIYNSVKILTFGIILISECGTGIQYINRHQLKKVKETRPQKKKGYWDKEVLLLAKMTKRDYFHFIRISLELRNFLFESIRMKSHNNEKYSKKHFLYLGKNYYLII